MRIGILSFAHLHAEGYQAALKQMPGVELVGFSHPDPQEAARYAQQFDLRYFGQDADLLAQGLDAAVICSENALHGEAVEQAAAAGCHILCEKPIEASLEAAQRMQAACEAHGVRFMTAFPMRFAPACLNVRSAVASGRLGPVLGVNGINHSEMPKAHRAWFADKALAGGGAAMDHIVHLADLLRFIFECEVEEVYAEIDNLIYPGEVDVDTAGLLLLKLSNGVQASIDCSWSRPNTYPRWGHLKMEVVAEGGAVVMDAFAQNVAVYSRKGPKGAAWMGWGPDANRAMLQEFVDSVRQGRAPSVDWNDGYQALRVVLAAYESARSHQPVKL